MGIRAPKPLPPPTDEERAAAAEAARMLKAVFADHALAGRHITAHVDCSRPRRAYWIETWSGLPGFSRVNGKYQHACLPGWEYELAELQAEMIPDLEALAERGVRPTEVTNPRGIHG